MCYSSLVCLRPSPEWVLQGLFSVSAKNQEEVFEGKEVFYQEESYCVVKENDLMKY